MPKESLKSATEVLANRISNPLVTSFIFAFLVINWKLISVFILSKSPIEQRLLDIEITYAQFDSLVIYPAISACFYLLGMPWLLLIYESVINYPLRLREKIKTDSETKLLASLLDRAKAKQKLNEIEQKNDRVESVMNFHEIQRAELASLHNDMNNFVKFLDQNQLTDPIAKRVLGEIEMYSSRTEYLSTRANNLSERLT